MKNRTDIKKNAQTVRNNQHKEIETSIGTSKKSLLVPPLRGEEYDGWAVDVSVPKNWNEEKDKDHSLDLLGVETKAEIYTELCNALERYHGVLDYAYCYLTKREFEPDGNELVFHHLPVGIKIQILKELFRRNDRNEAYRPICALHSHSGRRRYANIKATLSRQLTESRSDRELILAEPAFGYRFISR